MGQLFLANVSYQNQIVMYNLSTDRQGEYSERLAKQGHRQEHIPSGKQQAIGGDLHPNQMAEIIEQLEPYGLIAEKDIPNGMRGIHTLVYNIGVPVPQDKLRALHEHNTMVRLGQGATRRQAAAIASEEALTQRIAEPPPLYEVEIEQEEQSEAGEKRIEEGFRVTHDLAEAQRARKGR
jgi:hypothetical protein